MKKIENHYVRYGAKGIFLVKDIRKKTNQDGVIEDWYVLLSDEDGVMTSVMTPVNNSIIRPVLTKDEMHSLLQEMPNIPSHWLEDKRERFEFFKRVLDSGSIYDLVQMIKSIYIEQCKREEDAKVLSDKDKEIYMFAENLLMEEISISYNIKKDEVHDFILQHISPLS